MKKVILVTGATDGIGFETAKQLLSLGHHVLMHGRSEAKLKRVATVLSAGTTNTALDTYVADLSRLKEVENLATKISTEHSKLDVLINNAGVFKTNQPLTQDGMDVRFMVNTIAPYLLTTRLLPLMGTTARVVNLSSAAQSTVDLKAMAGKVCLNDNAAYAQSKLALTMWSRSMALNIKGKGPMIVAVNPGSLLGSKMVKEAFGVDGGDLRIGAEILCRAALSDEFANASGKYFDNDQGQFAPPHRDGLDTKKIAKTVSAIEDYLANYER